MAFPLTAVLPWFYDLRCYWEEQEALAGTALDMATRHNNAAQRAEALNGLALAHTQRRRPADALLLCHQAAAIAYGVNDVGREVWSRDRLGMALASLGRPTEAIREFNRAATLADACGFWWEEAAALNHLDHSYTDLGEPSRAIDAHTQAVKIFELPGSDGPEAMSRVGLGRALRAADQLAAAGALEERALAVFSATDDRWGLAYAQYELGLTRSKLNGDTTSLFTQAAAGFDETGDRHRHAEPLQALADLSG